LSAALNRYLHGIDSTMEPPALHEIVPDDEADAVEADVAVSRAIEDASGPALRPFDAHDVSPSHARQLMSEKVLKSPLENVSDRSWTDFALAMKSASLGTVSDSNAMGMFAMKARRLADLGLVKNVACDRSPTGRLVWVGDWVPPMTQKAFLASPKHQYDAFVESMRRYVDELDTARLEMSGELPEDMTLSGALAILHRCGPSGLKNWGNEEKRFPETIALYERANGVF